MVGQPNITNQPRLRTELCLNNITNKEVNWHEVRRSHRTCGLQQIAEGYWVKAFNPHRTNGSTIQVKVCGLKKKKSGRDTGSIY